MAVRKHQGIILGGRQAPAPHLFKMCLGFEKYAEEFLLSFDVPEEVDYSEKADAVLRDIFLNDEHGDCVIAGGYHVVGVETGNAGISFTRQKIRSFPTTARSAALIPKIPITPIMDVTR